MLTLTLVKGGQNERLGIEVEVVSWKEAIHQQGDRFAVRQTQGRGYCQQNAPAVGFVEVIHR